MTAITEEHLLGITSNHDGFMVYIMRCSVRYLLTVRKTENISMSICYGTFDKLTNFFNSAAMLGLSHSKSGSRFYMDFEFLVLRPYSRLAPSNLSITLRQTF